MSLGRDRGRAIARGVVAAGLALWASFAYPQSAALEYQVKASYLYNFVRFVAWPNDVFGNDAKFQLCVVGAERFGAALAPIAGERVEGREIVIRRLDRSEQARGARCHLLFIAAGAEAPDVGTERGTLTIGETPGFLAQGGMINLIESQGRIRFEINQLAAQRAGLVVSSRLLDLSKR
jgi:hypothetical protein